MEGITLKSRAIAFAFCVGAVAFILSVASAPDSGHDSESIARAIVVAMVCAVLSWASAERALSGIAEAIDGTIARVVAAAEGDLSTPTPQSVGAALPQLSGALDGMFAQVRTNLESATTLALYDPVTSLANRTHFRQEAERALRGLAPGEMAALAFIDLDHFKLVNDTQGHAIGDQVLAKIANRLRAVVAAETIRRGDSARETSVGRLAGDEFTVLLADIEGRDDAARVGAALLKALVKPIDIGGIQVTVGASIGIALVPEHGTTLTQIMRAADVAMYHAKASGRGQFQFYADSLAVRMARRTQLEVELRNALDNDEFATVFQPQITLATGEVQAVEGLLRWNHPTDGLRLPGTFLACAEESGLIHAIGDWAIESFAERVASWKQDALAPRITVNLSPRQIARPEFFARLTGSLARHRAPLSVIEFEVSELVLMNCGPAMLEQIAKLRADGARIAIDDFGSGSSSLTRLRSLPFDTVKLDASLVTGIDRDGRARDIAQAVIGLIHSLGAQAVAEGVETLAQLDFLRAMGCDAAQGYVIAPPMTEADCRVWLSKTRERMVA